MLSLTPRPLVAAAVLATVAVAAPTTSAHAAERSAATGCVSNAEYSKLAQGQRLSYIRNVAGDDAQISHRRWSRGPYRYQERLYDMCTPWNPKHGTLTTRFMVYEGAWRAYLVDTYIGPE